MSFLNNEEEEMFFLLNINHGDELKRSDLYTRSNNKYITKRVYTQNKLQFVYSYRFFFRASTKKND